MFAAAEAATPDLPASSALTGSDEDEASAVMPPSSFVVEAAGLPSFLLPDDEEAASGLRLRKPSVRGRGTSRVSAAHQQGADEAARETGAARTELVLGLDAALHLVLGELVERGRDGRVRVDLLQFLEEALARRDLAQADQGLPLAELGLGVGPGRRRRPRQVGQRGRERERERGESALVKLLSRLGRLERALPALLLDVDGGRVEVRVEERRLDLLPHVLVACSSRRLLLLLALALSGLDLLGLVLVNLGDCEIRRRDRVSPSRSNERLNAAGTHAAPTSRRPSGARSAS